LLAVVVVDLMKLVAVAQVDCYQDQQQYSQERHTLLL
jgi:hypothetical protein